MLSGKLPAAPPSPNQEPFLKLCVRFGSLQLNSSKRRGVGAALVSNRRNPEPALLIHFGSQRVSSAFDSGVGKRSAPISVFREKNKPCAAEQSGAEERRVTCAWRAARAARSGTGPHGGGCRWGSACGRWGRGAAALQGQTGEEEPRTERLETRNFKAKGLQ